MLVLAIDTGEKVDKETAWFCNKNRKYYSSKEGYQKWLKHKANQRYYQKRKKLSEKESEYKNKCDDLIGDWLDYKTTKKIPPVVFKRFKEMYEKEYSYEVIYKTMELQSHHIMDLLRIKSFDTDFNKACYICAVIANHLNDGVIALQNEQQAIAEAQQQAVNEHYPTQEELEMAWVQHDRTKELESIARVNETLNSILGEGWDE